MQNLNKPPKKLQKHKNCRTPIEVIPYVIDRKLSILKRKKIAAWWFGQAQFSSLGLNFDLKKPNFKRFRLLPTQKHVSESDLKRT